MNSFTTKTKPSSSCPRKQESSDETRAMVDDRNEGTTVPKDSGQQESTGDDDDDVDDYSSSLYVNNCIRRLPIRHEFPMKLHQLLHDAETNGNSHIVSWIPSKEEDGTTTYQGFQVHQPDKFTKTIMPNYFKQTRFTSFTRQVRNVFFFLFFCFVFSTFVFFPSTHFFAESPCHLKKSMLCLYKF